VTPDTSNEPRRRVGHRLRAAPSRLGALLGPLVIAGAFADGARAQLPVSGEPPPAVCGVVPALNPAEQRVVSALRATREKPPPPTETLSRAVAKDAADSVEGLLSILESRLVPALEGQPVQHLSGLQEELVQAGLRSLKRAAVMPIVEQHLAASSTSETRAGAITVLGLFGKSDDLRRIVGLATAQGEKPCDERTSTALTHAVASVLKNDAHAFEDLYRSTMWQQPAVVSAIIAGIGETRDSRGLSCLSELLVACPNLASEVLAQIQVVGPSFNRELDVECGTRALKYVEDASPSLSRSALLAVGTLEDERAIPALIALLDSEDEGLRADVWWSLRRISGKELPAQSVEWSRWYQAEDLWNTHERPRVLARLRDRDRALCSEAIRACMDHRLYRHQLAPALGELVRGADAARAVLAAQVLGELGSPVAIPWLNAAAEFDVSSVAQASRDALARIVARYPRFRAAGS
jgi:hypothetical protein